MAVVTITWTRDDHLVTLEAPYHSAAWLLQLGRTAEPCRRTGCKRPNLHPGPHYFTEDDVLPQTLNPNYRGRFT